MPIETPDGRQLTAAHFGVIVFTATTIILAVMAYLNYRDLEVARSQLRECTARISQLETDLQRCRATQDAAPD